MTSVLCGTEKAHWTVSRTSRTSNKLMGNLRRLKSLYVFVVADRLSAKENNISGYLSVMLTETAYFKCFSDLNKAENTIQITKITIQRNVTSIFSTSAQSFPFQCVLVLTALFKCPC